MSARVVTIEIHGQRYAVRSELDAQYVSELAGYLDEKMRQAARELTSAEPLRIAVIAALNICDELYRAHEQAKGIEGQMAARAEEIERLVDSVLANVRDHAVNS